jgi:kumamolisin
MRNSRTGFLISLLAIVSLSTALAETAALAAVPYPSASTPKAVDRGALAVLAKATPISVTIALRLPALGDAEALLKAISTPGDAQFHQFLTADEFVARFAPSNAEVASVIAGLAKYGLTAEPTSATTLKVTGLPANLERAFSVSLHSYEVAAHGNAAGYTFHAPLSRPTIPAEVAASVAGVVGLDSRPNFRPMSKAAPRTQAKARATVPNAATGDAFGSLTVIDFANLYDVEPLYKQHVSGAGRTIGIMTLASFTPSDAYAYWSALGLSVNPHRIKIVNIDGGPGAPSDVSGSLETTIDVEQSGGIAPGADVIVYQAPNTNQAFVDLFAAAIDANLAQSLSISWGEWEWFDNLENSPVTDPITGQTVGAVQAVHELLVRAAIQGQAVFTSSGDGGAYEVNDDLGCYGPYSASVPTSCSRTLSVDYPASDPAITAAGGTTLPGVQEYCLNSACTSTYEVDLKHERVWGWDYLLGFCAAVGTPDPVTCGIFPAGSGGGVSVLLQEPWYQFGVPGIQRSQPGQVFQANQALATADGIGSYFKLPSHYPGRNVPDVSFNADPETGYVVYYTSEPSGVFSPEPFWGGTSFVAPQLNGVTALLGQYLGESRLGLLNGALYGLVLSGQAYGGQHPPLHAIAYGDNWFYHGSNGYNLGAGVGTLDVANFAELLRGH